MVMKAVTKTRIVVGVIMLTVMIAISLPGLSMIFKDGKIGLNMEIGCDSIFEVDENTTVDSLTTNLNASYEKSARHVKYDGGNAPLTENNRSLAETIISYGKQTVTAVDEEGNTVRLESIDASTDDDKVIIIRIDTSSMAAKTIVPTLNLYFVKGDYRMDTDSKMNVKDGTIEITVSIPMASFVVAQTLGCDMMMDLKIDYVKILSFSTTMDMGNMAESSTDVKIVGGVETIKVDIGKDFDTYSSYFKNYDGTSVTINGIPIKISVDDTNRSISLSGNVGDKNLSSVIKSNIGLYDNKIVLSNGTDRIEIAADQAEDILGLLAYLEGSE